MARKLPKKKLSRIIAGCALAVMLAVNFLSIRFSSITLMILAGTLSLGVYFVKGGSKK